MSLHVQVQHPRLVGRKDVQYREYCRLGSGWRPLGDTTRAEILTEMPGADFLFSK